MHESAQSDRHPILSTTGLAQRRNRRCITLRLQLATALAAWASAVAADAAPPPSNLIPKDAEQAFATTATGLQIYSCEYDGNHRIAWVFQHPEATLYDASGVAVIRHGAGPSWEARDGSRIVGEKIADAPSPNAGSIPQLLLSTHAAANGSLASVRYVQRLDTTGGAAPATPCSAEHQVGSSPYYAHYVFWK